MDTQIIGLGTRIGVCLFVGRAMPRNEPKTICRNRGNSGNPRLLLGIPAAVSALILVAIALPIVLIGIYAYFRNQSGRERAALAGSGGASWLSETEIEDYLWERNLLAQRLSTTIAHNEMVDREIFLRRERALLASVPVNLDGKLSRVNRQGRSIRKEIEELEASRRGIRPTDLLGNIECRQPRAAWERLNSLLRKQYVTLFALMGWSSVACYFLTAYFSGVSLNPIVDPVVMMGGAIPAAALAAAFYRDPALRYLPKPAWVTAENFANPTMELLQRDRRWIRLILFGVWLVIAALFALEGANY